MDADDLLFFALELGLELFQVGIAGLLGLLLLLCFFVEALELLLAFGLEDGHSDVLFLESSHFLLLLSDQRHELLFQLVELAFLGAVGLLVRGG